ncbi:MAG TPA: helix-turn-helix domain-containing protein [Hypericibacter adhaerens]|jgi:DNA-binding transcriptional MerR regulator|nr:helix-turn-helix domain-containing protein [Hypericibacter adhaerens]HWA46518.1 helix-turn-helix domain-containing protein [Hypericibacter adhaerens]
MPGAGTYTAETLAFRAGVPLRTVRFYVQEKLIDPPLARGRGANFTEHHLVQLQQARTLQNAGFTLDAIRERRGELSVGLHAMAAFDTAHRGWLGRERTGRAQEDDALDEAECIRIPMTKGVELMVSRDQPLPSPRQLVEIALHIRKAFGG